MPAWAAGSIPSRNCVYVHSLGAASKRPVDRGPVLRLHSLGGGK